MNYKDIQFTEAIINGIQVKITRSRLDYKTIPDGLNYYDINTDGVIYQFVMPDRFFGTIITEQEMDFSNGPIVIESFDLNPNKEQ